MVQNQEVENKFFADVTAALGEKSPPYRAPNRNKEEVGPPVFWREQDKVKENILDLFKTNLEALTGRVEVVKDKAGVHKKLKEWVQELNAKTLIAWDYPQLKELAKPEQLGLNIKFWNTQSSSDELIDFTAKADIGLTWADYAIAYTGSIAVFSGPNKGRSVTLLPPNHIVVLKKDMIVPTMSNVLKALKEKYGTDDMPSSLNFITGPSRSADIEMDLSIGVHGPYNVWVIILDE